MSTAAPILSINSKKEYAVPVLIGAADHLVTLREESAKGYMINPHLRYWATWFLLKSFTTSGVIQQWNKQKRTLLDYLRISDCTFRSQLNALQRLNLITEDYKKTGNITLCSYKEAAQIMGISYKGTTAVQYKPFDYENERQVFRYILVAQEVQSNQDNQLQELYRKFQKNLSGNATELLNELRQLGYTDDKLKTAKQFQQALLRLQKIVFRDKSGLTAVAFSLRADVNRSVTTWARQHGYQSGQGASYIKKKFRKLGIAVIEQHCINSNDKSRLYWVDKSGNKHEGYKWNKTAQRTAWRLCDQVSIQITPTKKEDDETRKKAA
ncbi:hypothetical protein IQ13_3225 [Lacibacter cauensis]|uniref:Uncharacterized protein n=1 Tax=Lacibacter cauensis TaxID=510947 RepID=A0A562SGZ3_9BACT|nr:hypothetical protein [Lacibacter cauensis]TWI80547.1 hypothetical protein IQ13_3225 [Lacibacter cauensis]